MGNNGALIFGNGLLILVGLGGGIFTLTRGRTTGRLASGLTLGGCAVLLLDAAADMLFWTVIFPSLQTDTEGSLDRLTSITQTNSILFAFGIAVASVLLLLGVHMGRQAPPSDARYPDPVTPIRVRRPSDPVPSATADPGSVPGLGPAPTPPGAGQPTVGQPSGWVPPQQAQSNEWNVMSGVWSIPRGTFDGPPPEQHR